LGAGSALTVANSNNICIGTAGVAGDSGEIRIGTSGTHVKNFQTGIHGMNGFRRIYLRLSIKIS